MNAAAAQTIAQALAEAHASGIERLDAQLLLAHGLACPRTWVLAHDEALLSLEQVAAFRHAMDRRLRGEPLAYLLAEKEFYGLSLRVNPSVLVPRPDTETLVDWAVELLTPMAARSAPYRVIDLGTGSGAIALAVKQAAPTAQVTAVDISAAALEVAVSNAQRHSLDVRFLCGHWWQPLEGQRFELALSNPPYIAQADDHLVALQHEPPLALVAGSDGLDALREIIALAPSYLSTQAWLLVEHGHDQAAAVRSLFSDAGFAKVQTRCDLSGVARCTGACLA